MTSVPEDGALGSVLGLERALETAQAAAVDAETTIERARGEAYAILAAARERAERQAAHQRGSLIAVAEAEASAAAADAEAAAAQLRAQAREVEATFVDAAVELVLPAAAPEATCSSR